MIFCEHPTFIYNKMLKNISKRHLLVSLYDGVPTNDYINKDAITEENYALYEVLDTTTGEVYPRFLAVECGKCLLCQERRKNTIVRRLNYAAQTCNGNIYAVTLSYAPKYIDEALQFEQIQKYVKRVRIALERDFNYTDKFDWFVASEHGAKSDRPHWHMIFLGLPFIKPYQREKLFGYGVVNYQNEELAEKSRWKFGHTYIDNLSDDETKLARTIGYTTKYCVKSAVGSEYKEMQKWSQGLGSDLIRQKQRFVYANANARNLKYYDYSTGETKPMIIDKVTLYYMFDKHFYSTYLKARRWLEQFGTKEQQKVIDMLVEENELLLDYAPTCVNKHTLSFDEQHIADTCVRDIVEYSKRKQRERLFVTNNVEQIDPDTFKEIRNIRLQKIKQDIATRRDKEKL